MRPGSKRFYRVTKPPLFLLALGPFAWALAGAFGWAGMDLGADPVEALLNLFGLWSLRFLLLGLAITPLRQITGWNWLLAYRRMLGLFAFFYLVLHFLTYAILDRALDWRLVLEDVAKRPFITIGFLALLLLVPLAVTSTRGWMRRLGRRWQSLHRLVYPAAILGVWHFYWQVKLDTVEPTVYAAILAALLGWRIRAWLVKRRRIATRAARAAGVAGLLVAGPVSVALAQAVDMRYERVSSRPNVVDIRHAGDGSGDLYLVSQQGRVWRRDEAGESVFLDLRDRVRRSGEQGLLSLAFAPDYPDTGHFYTWYTDDDGDTVLSRFRATGGRVTADPDSETVLLRIPQPRANHNGGQLRFGPDGFLYLSTGDGGGGGDPFDNGQDLDTLLGGLLRLDVDPANGTYAVPRDNPLIGRSGRNELWAWGLRNPWRIAFDSLTGDLFIADVGQNSYEEINVQPLLDGGGQNYGWNVMEGNACFEPGCNTSGLVRPVGGYSHANGCSVTGGVVYRGNAYPDLHGAYLFGDFCNGRIWSLRRVDGDWSQTLLDDSPYSILTFGTGEDGSVYLSAAGDGVYRLSDGPVVAEAPFRINAGLNDAWFEPATAGQGFFINVFPDRGELYLSWFTWDTERPDNPVAALGDPGHRWLTAQGAYASGVADLQVTLTRGGRFDRVDPAPQSTPAGTLRIAFSDCRQALVTYRFPELGLAGQVPLRRVTDDNVALCEALSASPAVSRRR